MTIQRNKTNYKETGMEDQILFIKVSLCQIIDKSNDAKTFYCENYYLTDDMEDISKQTSIFIKQKNMIRISILDTR